MTSTGRHFALPYAEQLRQPDRPQRTRIRALRERGDREAAARLEAALDRIARAFRP
jgi:hypothetical protein